MTAAYDYAQHHDAQHGDRTGAGTKYVEVCWLCAEDWRAYVEARIMVGVLDSIYINEWQWANDERDEAARSARQDIATVAS